MHILSFLIDLGHLERTRVISSHLAPTRKVKYETLDFVAETGIVESIEALIVYIDAIFLSARCAA